MHADGEVVGKPSQVDRVAHPAERPGPGVAAGSMVPGKHKMCTEFGCVIRGLVVVRLVLPAMFALSRNWSSR